MSAIYNYSDSISAGNTLNETLAAMNRQIDAQNSLSRDNFNVLRQDEKNNKIAANNNLNQTKVKDRESEGLEGAGVITTINELAKRRGAANKLAKGFANQAEEISSSVKPAIEGGNAGEALSTASRSVSSALSGLPSLPSANISNSSPAEVVGAASKSGPILARDASRGSDLPSLDFFNGSPSVLPGSSGVDSVNEFGRNLDAAGVPGGAGRSPILERLPFEGEADDLVRSRARLNFLENLPAPRSAAAPSAASPAVSDIIKPIASEGPTPSGAGVARESLRESLKATGVDAPTFASRNIAQSTLPEGSEANLIGGAAEVAEKPAEDVVEDVGKDVGGSTAGEVVGGLLKGATIATGAYDAIKDIADPKSFHKLDKLGTVSNIAGIVTGGLETAGLAADATGIGAVVGVPLQALGLVSGAVGLGAGVLDDIFGEKKKQAAVKRLPTIAPAAKAPQQSQVAFRSALGGGELVQ